MSDIKPPKSSLSLLFSFDDFFERDIERERESEKKDRERERGLPFADHAPDAPSSQSWKHKTPSTLQQDL